MTDVEEGKEGGDDDDGGVSVRGLEVENNLHDDDGASSVDCGVVKVVVIVLIVLVVCCMLLLFRFSTCTILLLPFMKKSMW